MKHQLKHLKKILYSENETDLKQLRGKDCDTKHAHEILNLLSCI